MAKFPTFEEMARDVANRALDEFEYRGRTIRQWIDAIAEQPERICCKDCRYYDAEEKQCLDLMGHGRRWEENDYCSYAERRTGWMT